MFNPFKTQKGVLPVLVAIYVTGAAGAIFGGMSGWALVKSGAFDRIMSKLGELF